MLAPPGPLGIVFVMGDDGYAVVKMVKAGSPLLGVVLVGDNVTAVDGEDTSKHTHHELVDHLKSKVDTTRELTVLRMV